MSERTGKHTPGKWQIRPLSSSIRIYAPMVNNEEICILTKSMYIDAAKVMKEANARLIAAAPELLEALETCQAELVMLKARLTEPARSNVTRAAAIAGAAINKALGNE